MRALIFIGLGAATLLYIWFWIWISNYNTTRVLNTADWACTQHPAKTVCTQWTMNRR